MASKIGPITRSKRQRLNASTDSCRNATPAEVETTVSAIRDDMRELEELRKKSTNISGMVSGRMREAIARVEKGLDLLTAKACEAEKLRKRVESLTMENVALMAKHCTYANRASPAPMENKSGMPDTAQSEEDTGARDSVSVAATDRYADTEREDFREEFRKLREFVAEEIRGVKEERKAASAMKKSYASCVKTVASKRAELDVRQTAGPSKPKVPEKRSVARESTETRRKEPKNLPVIIRVRCNATPYSEMVAKIKRCVNPSDFNVSVLSLQKSPAGEAEFRLSGLTEEANRFEDAIRVCLGQDGTLKKVQAMSFVHISDLELDISEETIIRDLSKACKIGVEDIKVTSLRPAFGCTLKASVKMPKKAAEFLRNTGRTIVGYVSCRCKIREFAPRCFRCGESGHLAANCTGPDYTGKCFKCGSEKHKVAECPEKMEEDKGPRI